jgi:hypothetical protein
VSRVLVFGVKSLVFRAWIFSAECLRRRVHDLGFRVRCLESSVWCLVLSVECLGRRVHDLGFQVRCLESSAWCLVLSVECLGRRVHDLGFTSVQ